VGAFLLWLRGCTAARQRGADFEYRPRIDRPIASTSLRSRGYAAPNGAKKKGSEEPDVRIRPLIPQDAVQNQNGHCKNCDPQDQMSKDLRSQVAGGNASLNGLFRSVPRRLENVATIDLPIAGGKTLLVDTEDRRFVALALCCLVYSTSRPLARACKLLRRG
jgi:hypothetical protein